MSERKTMRGYNEGGSVREKAHKDESTWRSTLAKGQNHEKDRFASGRRVREWGSP